MCEETTSAAPDTGTTSREALVADFVKAIEGLIAPAAPEPVTKASETLAVPAELMAVVTKMAEGLDALTAKVNELGTNEETTRDALVKSLDRISTLEGATAVRKSVDGDDAIPSPVKKASEGAGVSFANVVQRVLKGERVTMGHPGN